MYTEKGKGMIFLINDRFYSTEEKCSSYSQCCELYEENNFINVNNACSKISRNFRKCKSCSRMHLWVQETVHYIGLYTFSISLLFLNLQDNRLFRTEDIQEVYIFKITNADNYLFLHKQINENPPLLLNI